MNTSNQPENSRILIVDDNVGIQDDFRKILSSNPQSLDELISLEAQLFDVPEAAPTINFELESALQGRDGFEMVANARKAGRPYAMAFIDVRMPPGWDGIETSEKICEIDPDLQIVLCTAYSDYSWSEMFTRIGASDRLMVLKKPFDNVEVLQMAHALTAKWNHTQALSARITELEHTVEELQAQLRKLRSQVS